MMWSGNWDTWGSALVMSLAMLVFWGGLAWLIVYGIRNAHGDQAPSASTAIQQLEERFARGEIDTDEFEERRKVLTATAA
jgi:putative membrane protein